MPGWALVARALEEYLEGRSPSHGDDRVLKRFLSREEAGQRLGLSVNQVDRLVEGGKLRSVAGIVERSTSWIDSRSLNRLLYDIKKALPIGEAAADLGIGVGQIKDLADYGFLDRELASKTDGYSGAKFSRKTLNAFLKRLRHLIPPFSEGDEFRGIHLGQVAYHLGRHELSFGQFVQAVFAGFPLPAREHHGPQGRLSRFWFRVDEINRYLDLLSDSARSPAGFHYTVPSLRGVVGWLDRRQEEGDNRFYRRHPQSLNATSLWERFCRVNTVEDLGRILSQMDGRRSERDPTNRSVSW